MINILKIFVFMNNNSKLKNLKKYTKIVADTGDIDLIKFYKPEDVTTNPSLIFQAINRKDKKYEFLVQKAVKDTKNIIVSKKDRKKLIIDYLSIFFGIEILKLIPGRISIEIDPRLSFSTKETIKKSEFIIKFFKKSGIDRERILIKIASTWEGIKAAEILSRRNILCNMTLLFSLPQAIACANSKVQLISPFVGRIMDWYSQKFNKKYYSNVDPGVNFVKEIYNYYKYNEYKTEIMGASFRNIDEILELSGCDCLTINPIYLERLKKEKGEIKRNLIPNKNCLQKVKKIFLNEEKFRWLLNENEMASDKLSEGIRLFTNDVRQLEKIL
jgi:transaldolase